MLVDVPSLPALANLEDRLVERTKRGLTPDGDQVLRKMMHASPLLTACLTLTGPSEAPFNGRYVATNANRAWDYIVTTHNRFAVLAARGLGKSEYFAKARPLHQAHINPGGSFFLSASTDDNAKLMLRKIREEIENNPKLMWMYPTRAKGKVWTAHEIVLSNGFHIICRSALSAVRGLHPDDIHLDDIIKQEAQYSELYRGKLVDYMFKVISGMAKRYTRIGFSGTPLHRKDLGYKTLRDNKRYRHFTFPATRNNGAPMCPEIHSAADLEAKKEEMSDLVYTQEMMCNPVSDSMSLFPKELFLREPQGQMAFTLGLPPDQIQAMGLRTYIGVDLAFSAETGTDYFVIFIIGDDADGNLWWVDIKRHHGMSYQDQQTILNSLCQLYRPGIIHIESNAAQSIFGKEMIRKSRLPIRLWTTGVEKHDMRDGLPQLRRLAETGKWRIPRGDKASVEMTDIVLEELQSFIVGGKGVQSLGEHDDTVLALWMAVEAAKAGNAFAFSVGGRVRTAADIARERQITGQQQTSRPQSQEEIMGKLHRMGAIR